MNKQLNAWEIFSIIESLKQRAIRLRHEGTELDRIGKSASAGDELRVVARCIDDLIVKLDKSNSVTIR